jgi:hypothetical protein
MESKYYEVLVAQVPHSLWHADTNTPSYHRLDQILQLFADTPSAPFSVHRIAIQGQHLEKQIGQWLGPNTASTALKYEATDHKETRAMHIVMILNNLSTTLPLNNKTLAVSTRTIIALLPIRRRHHLLGPNPPPML